MKIIVAPDKFKGSLTSFEVCKAIGKGTKRADKSVKLLEFPMADGGDGFAAVMKHYHKTKTVNCDTVDPLGRNLTVSYEWNENEKTAIIEIAVASGLVLLIQEELNPMLTSTLGTGLMIKDAIGKGARKIILGLGGSATNDAGTGILSALGFQFADERDKLLQACGGNLVNMKKIIKPSLIPTIKFEIASDVQNTLYGPQGAAYVYAAQKGADEEQVKTLDKGLQNFAAIIKNETGKDISSIPGTGAAGGIAAGLLPFFNVEMKKGIEMIVDASKIKTDLTDADLLITGEGKIDEQSGEGKVVGYMAKLAGEYDIPCIAVCGILELKEAGIKTLGLQKAVAISNSSITKEEAMKNARELLAEKASEILNFFEIIKKGSSG
jgi:glycerate kinase